MGDKTKTQPGHHPHPAARKPAAKPQVVESPTEMYDRVQANAAASGLTGALGSGPRTEDERVSDIIGTFVVSDQVTNMKATSVARTPIYSEPTSDRATQSARAPQPNPHPSLESLARTGVNPNFVHGKPQNLVPPMRSAASDRPVNLETDGAPNLTQQIIAGMFDRAGRKIPGADFGSVRDFNHQLSGADPRVTITQREDFLAAGKALAAELDTNPMAKRLVREASGGGSLNTLHLAAIAAAIDEYHTRNPNGEPVGEYLGSRAMLQRVGQIEQALKSEPLTGDKDPQIHQRSAPTPSGRSR